MSKLSVADMRHIAEADPEKHSRKDLAEKYGVSVARIGEILRGPKGNDHFPKALLESTKKAAKPKAAKAKPSKRSTKKDERPVARPSESETA